MALSSTVFVLDIDLADNDRGVYESLPLRVARHPSESDEFLVARVLAYCLEYAEGIEFSRGLCDADEPPVAIRDLTGRMTSWIDVGTPSAERLHRAAKAVPRVVVYAHKSTGQWLDSLAGERIHRAEALQIRQLDRPLVDALARRLDRRMAWTVSVAGGELFVVLPSGEFSGPVVPVSLAAGR